MAIKSFFRLATASAILLCCITVRTEGAEQDNEPKPRNFAPIIGILAQSMQEYRMGSPPKEYTSFIPTSYVKFIEGAGARVVPMLPGQSDRYYKYLMSQINGVLFLGSSVSYNKDVFLESARIIHRIADGYNAGGEYFPLWSMLEGLQLVINSAQAVSEQQQDCPPEKKAPFSSIRTNRGSRMLRNTPVDLLGYISRPENRVCISREVFENFGLNNDYRPISVIRSNKLELIPDIEHIRKPYYYTQTDPHIILYDWSKNHTITDRHRFVRTSQYLGNFFVNEARKNTNYFIGQKEEMDSLIYNYSPMFLKYQGTKLAFYMFNKLKDHSFVIES